jgi:hypothetical protein
MSIVFKPFLPPSTLALSISSSPGSRSRPSTSTIDVRCCSLSFHKWHELYWSQVFASLFPRTRRLTWNWSPCSIFSSPLFTLSTRVLFPSHLLRKFSHFLIARSAWLRLWPFVSSGLSCCLSRSRDCCSLFGQWERFVLMRD